MTGGQEIQPVVCALSRGRQHEDLRCFARRWARQFDDAGDCIDLGSGHHRGYRHWANTPVLYTMV